MKNNILNQIKDEVENNDQNNNSSVMMNAFRDFLKTKIKVEDLDNTPQERSYEDSISDEFKKMKQSNEPIFCISPSVVWSMQNENTSIGEYVKKKVKYKWVGKSGILITKSNLMKFLQVAFRRITGMSLSFDEKSKGIYWTKVFKFKHLDSGAILLNQNPVRRVYDNFDSITDTSKIYVINSGFCNYDKFIKKISHSEEQLEVEKAIKVYKIREKYRKKKIYEKTWISRISLEKAVGWLKDFNNPSLFDHEWYAKKILSLGLIEGIDWNEIGIDIEDFEFTPEAAQKLLSSSISKRYVKLENLIFND